MSADTNSLLERLPLLHGRVIDYGQKASPSKARHNIPSSENDEESIIAVLAVDVSKNIPTHLLYSFAPRHEECNWSST